MIRSLYPGAYEAILNNGMRVLAEEVPHSRSVSVGLWFRVGSRDDPDELSGLAHFIEHLVFKGTQHRDGAQISAEIDAIGGHLNAATAKESTCFYADVPADGLSIAIDVIADLALSPALAPDKIDLERGVVLEEIRAHEDDPEQSAYEIFSSNVWTERHPLSRSVLGEKTTIAAVARDAIADHHRRYYDPANSALVVCGAVDHRSLLDEAARRFPGSSAAAPAGRRLRSSPVLHPAIAHHDRPTGQTHIYLGLPGPSAIDDDRFPLEVANSVFGDGTSSRLFRMIREERGLAYAVSSSVTHYSDGGLWLTYAGVAPSAAQLAIELIRSELQRLREENISEEEVSLAKSKLRGYFILGMETNSNRMARLGSAAMTNREVLSPDDLLARIDRVTPDDVVRAARQFNAPDRMNLATVGPRG